METKRTQMCRGCVVLWWWEGGTYRRATVHVDPSITHITEEHLAFVAGFTTYNANLALDAHPLPLLLAPFPERLWYVQTLYVATVECTRWTRTTCEWAGLRTHMHTHT
jgi:hypothetical protein